MSVDECEDDSEMQISVLVSWLICQTEQVAIISLQKFFNTVNQMIKRWVYVIALTHNEHLCLRETFLLYLTLQNKEQRPTDHK